MQTEKEQSAGSQLRRTAAAILHSPRTRRTGLAAVSFGITLILFLLLNIFYGIFPCGTNSIVWCDMEQQAVPLLMQLRQMVKSGEFSSFSPYSAGGMHFYAVFFFFLSNPLSLLSLLTDYPADRLVTLFVIIKLSLASGTAAFWFRGRIPALPAPLTVLLGVMYGCSGYGLFYYQNLMWLDIMILLPLLMVSMRHLLKKANPFPFLCVLSASVILCFYLSYMIVLFVILYIAVSVRTTVPAARQGIIARRFLLSGICAAGLTAFVWLPCLLQVMQSGRGVSVVHMLKYSGLFNHLGDKVCLLGCTCLGFAALPQLWQKQTPRISSRRRDRRIFLLLTFAAVLDPINMMWHGGSYQAFPLRWGMIPILLMLTLAGKQLAGRYEDTALVPERKSRRTALLCVSLSMAAAFGFGLYLFLARQDDICSYVNDLWVSSENACLMLPLIVLLFSSYLFLITFRQHRLLSDRLTVILLAVLFAGEFAFHYSCYFGRAANDDALYAQTVSAENAVTPAEDTARLKLTKKYAHANMIGAIGYPTLAHYTSLTREDFLYGMKRLGFSSYWMEVPSTGGTLLSDALWNNRYQLGADGDFPEWTTKIWTDGLLGIAENKNLLPSALYTDQPAAQLAALPAGSRIAVQDYLAKTLLGVRGAVITYAPTELNNVTLQTGTDGKTVCTLDDPEQAGEIRYSLFVKTHQALYFDLYSQKGTELDDPMNGAVAVRCNGRTRSESYPEDNGNGFVYIGSPDAEYLVVSIRVKHDFCCESFGLFGLELAPLTEAIRQAEGTELHYKNGVYSAECSTDRPRTLVLSAAYDEGFTAAVNGKPAPVFRLNSCQMGVELPEGKSTVILRYHVPGLRIGLLLGGGTLFAAVLLFLLRRKLPKELLRFGSHVSAIMLQAGYILLLLAVYLFPLVIWAFGTIMQALTPD